jgi:hypothetical protein
MPPHARRVIPPLQSEPSSPGLAPALQVQVNSASHDSLDLGDVTDASGSDDADEPAKGYDLYVNNPDTIPILPPRPTADILFFFDNTGTEKGKEVICKVCQ